MALDHIRLTDFRNHRDSTLVDSGQFNVLFGDNGAGKTNVLEALSLLAPGRGLRGATLAELAAHDGVGTFAVSARLRGGPAGGPVQLGTGTTPERPGRRIVQVNGAEATAVSLGEWLSVGWLTPAMDRLFADSAGARRRYLDRLVLALEPDHARAVGRYEAALRERNRLLGDPNEPEPAWLDALEAQLGAAGARVSEARTRLVDALASALAAMPSSPFARPELAYRSGGPVESDALTAALAAGRRRDRAAQRTLTGPHRDELAVRMAGKGIPAADCSTGEQKAMLIAITLAHATLLDATRPRLLLLDEVAAHLDPVRREALFERLREGPAQIWLTGTELAPFSAIAASAAVWQVTYGRLERVG
ncbi:MAG: DNA replication/repair protein RecF [Sphingomonadales bacterium]|nr:DNA replication/repair protein RecF [Sphingomonadales bacterium]